MLIQNKFTDLFAMTIIPRAFIGIAQGCVGVGNLLESLGGFIQVIGIFI
jgi:hypothetical protein